jgi:DNA-binding NarL/FixJ family response regulator
VSRVVLVAPTRLALGTLEEALGHEPHVTVAVRATQLDAALRPPVQAGGDVAVVAVDRVSDLRRAITARDDDARPLPLVVLVPPDDLTDAAALLAGGVVRAVLPRHASTRELLAAIESAQAGLVTLVPDALPGIGRNAARVQVGLAPSPTLVPLSPREREILALVADGLGNKIVAARLGISEHTVKTHITSIFTKLGAESRAEAVAIGARVGALML